MVRGDEPRASELFDDALAALGRLGDPTTRARTLLMAGWVPFWRNDLERAETMFREALEVARTREPRDAWAESRALVGIANVISPVGDEAGGPCASGWRPSRSARRPARRSPRPAPTRPWRGRSGASCGWSDALRARRGRHRDAARAGRPVGAGERARRTGRDPSPSGAPRRRRAGPARGVRPVPRPEGAGARDLDRRGARADPRDAGRHGSGAADPRRPDRADRGGRARVRHRAPVGRGRPRPRRARPRDRPREVARCAGGRARSHGACRTRSPPRSCGWRRCSATTRQAARRRSRRRGIACTATAGARRSPSPISRSACWTSAGGLKAPAAAAEDGCMKSGPGPR